MVRKKVTALNFKSKKDYKKWLAYNWIHNKGVMGKAPNVHVSIRGKPHSVLHKHKHK